jgi:putative exporter of polyketide antibiotics
MISIIIISSRSTRASFLIRPALRSSLVHLVTAPTLCREVARLKDESWRSKGERAETLWARAVERNDRPWLILCAALLGVAVVLLTAVAWRLDHLPLPLPGSGVESGGDGGGGSSSVVEGLMAAPLASLHLLMVYLSLMQ